MQIPRKALEKNALQPQTRRAPSIKRRTIFCSINQSKCIQNLGGLANSFGLKLHIVILIWSQLDFVNSRYIYSLRWFHQNQTFEECIADALERKCQLPTNFNTDDHTHRKPTQITPRPRIKYWIIPLQAPTQMARNNLFPEQIYKWKSTWQLTRIQYLPCWSQASQSLGEIMSKSFASQSKSIFKMGTQGKIFCALNHNNIGRHHNE